MGITLKPKHEKLITEAIQTGAYRDTDDVLDRALAMLRSEDEFLSDQKDEVNDKIERALEQFERGQFFTPDESLAEMANQKEDWLRKRQQPR